MAIEIVPKPAEKIPSSLNVLFFLSLILLSGIIFSYLVLVYLEKKVPDEIQRLDTEIARGRTPEEINLENEVKMKKKKIDDFSKIISGHKFPSKFFDFSEGPFSETKKFGSLIHPRVQILNLSLNLKDSKLNISGLTENFITLEQQFMIFQQEALLKEVNLSNFSLGKEGKINFNFDLSFNPSIFK